MRPSNLATPLAILRTMLTTEITRKDSKGRSFKARVPLASADIARWLDCSIANVRSIESGRTNLTMANAWIIVQRTGVNVHWLIDGDPTKAPLNQEQRPYS